MPADVQPHRAQLNHRDRFTLVLIVTLAAATVLVHLFTGNRYGFHRDELATLDDARHLAWGYVAYPPVTPFFGWVSLHLFDTSLAGFRFFAALAGAVAMVLAGLIARELGGGRAAQLLAVCATAPFTIAAGSLMQYVSFDYVAWAAVAYSVTRLGRTRDPRWWLAVGAAVGFGMLSKYSMPFLVAGVGVGVTLGPLRARFRSRWLYLGAALALVIFLPNFVWQWQHHFISLEFLRTIHARDIRIGRTDSFLPDQLLLTLCALPLALAGLCFCFLARDGRFRILGWMYVVPLLLFIVGKGRGYYLAPAYPMLYAAGSVWGEQWLKGRRRVLRMTVATFAFLAVATNIVFISALFLPLAPLHSRWWEMAVKINGDFREEMGWPELVEEVARIRDSLPPGERERVAVLAGNYGEAGAINLYGPRCGLPPAICPVNSFWARGYGDPPPEIVIVLGFSRARLEARFGSCELAGQITNRAGIANEETTDHPEIFVCRRLRGSWQDFWPKARRFGWALPFNQLLTAPRDEAVPRRIPVGPAFLREENAVLLSV